MHPFDRLERNRRIANAYNKKKREEATTPSKWLAIRLPKLKGKAKERGLSCSITEGDIKINNICPILGIPINPKSENIHERPSIDRIDNSLGYVPGNVRMISGRANWLKSNMTFEEVELLYKNWNEI